MQCAENREAVITKSCLVKSWKDLVTTGCEHLAKLSHLHLQNDAIQGIKRPHTAEELVSLLAMASNLVGKVAEY